MISKSVIYQINYNLSKFFKVKATQQGIRDRQFKYQLKNIIKLQNIHSMQSGQCKSAPVQDTYPKQAQTEANGTRKMADSGQISGSRPILPLPIYFPNRGNSLANNGILDRNQCRIKVKMQQNQNQNQNQLGRQSLFNKQFFHTKYPLQFNCTNQMKDHQEKHLKISESLKHSFGNLFQIYCQQAYNRNNFNFIQNMSSRGKKNCNTKAEKCENLKQNLIVEFSKNIQDQCQDDGQAKKCCQQPRSQPSCCQNPTKNIPKNFGKAIISFLQKNPKLVKKCLNRHNMAVQPFLQCLKNKKKILHSIRQLRSLWLEDDFPYARPFRKAGYRYVFYSRANDFDNCLKYRGRIMRAIECPIGFNSVKI